jgi:hypothetical protein
MGNAGTDNAFPHGELVVWPVRCRGNASSVPGMPCWIIGFMLGSISAVAELPAGWLGVVLPGPRGRLIDSWQHTRAGSPAESMGNMGAFGRGDVLSALFGVRRRALWRRGPWGQGLYRRQVGLVLAWSAAR